MASLLDISTLEVPAHRAPRARRSQIRLTIALHPDLRRVGDWAELPALEAGKLTLLSRRTPEFFSPDGRPTGPLGDPYISRTALHLTRHGKGLRIACNGYRTALRICTGTETLEGATIDPAALERGLSLTLGERIVLLLQRTPVVNVNPPKYGLVGESPAIIEVRRRISEVAGLPIPVLIRGESGTGKELVARALHAGSPRAARPYMSINMAALPEQLAVAELFGHARGSFTGAVQARDGYFREGNGGTIFLDEVGEASVEIQAALLRVLETGEVQALGGGATKRVDIRVLAATDADLEKMILEGSFRSALYHRIAAYELRVPPLRERPGDIARLFVHFLEVELSLARRNDLFEQIAADTAEALPVMVMERLLEHTWPGNVRELNNITRRIAAALCARSDVREVVAELNRSASDVIRDGPIGENENENGPSNTAQFTVAKRQEDTSSTRQSAAASSQPASFSDAALIAALEDHAWNISATSRALKTSRSTLYSRIRQCTELHTASDLPHEHLLGLRERHDGDLAAMATEARVSVRALQLRMQALGLLSST